MNATKRKSCIKEAERRRKKNALGRVKLDEALIGRENMFGKQKEYKS